MTSWPVVEVDAVRRLRIVAAALPYVALDEAVFDAPLDRVWGLVGDLVHGVPQFERGIDEVEILREEEERLEVVTRYTPLRLPMRFAVELRRGWCLMQSPYAQIGMAAVSEDGGRKTRFAHFEGSPALGVLARPYFRWNVAGDLRRIAELLRGGQP
jgi:hypothetical protein